MSRKIENLLDNVKQYARNEMTDSNNNDISRNICANVCNSSESCIGFEIKGCSDITNDAPNCSGDCSLFIGSSYSSIADGTCTDEDIPNIPNVPDYEDKIKSNKSVAKSGKIV